MEALSAPKKKKREEKEWRVKETYDNIKREKKEDLRTEIKKKKKDNRIPHAAQDLHFYKVRTVSPAVFFFFLTLSQKTTERQWKKKKRKIPTASNIKLKRRTCVHECNKFIE